MARRASALPPLSEPEVHALLGPTNTGKTHHALERMLRHGTGMIGLPLRLLAREVYDRLTERAGEEAVALVTGEERRVPRRPRYWVCTVEAMPLARGGADPLGGLDVDFLAVDEIQLAADPARGHVFTDRILHARGRFETLFLGSDTMAPLLARMVPGIRIEGRPRLSRLSFAGHHRLGGLPRRSAVVAFSGERVYALAERVRARHGGAAVVMGALSPRTRNAQVAMFQAGEVPVLVATDAIGMGLNMELGHVAFAELHKYDGRKVRGVYAAEAGQIAGRAGRYREDGTFGSTDACDGVPADLARAVQEQRFPAVRRAWWRSGALDTQSVAALRRSLVAPPPAPWLERAAADEDEQALDELSRRGAVAERATDDARVALLWEVCRVPDFRKLLTDAHTDLLERVYVRLVDRGTLAASWIARQVEHLDRVDGDLDALTTRLAFIRTWTYISHRAGWLDDAHGLQETTRAVEDRLSDALHQRLTERFVDRRALVLAGGGPGEVHGDQVRVGGVEVGRLDGLALVGAEGALPGRVREIVGAELAARVEALVDDDASLFAVDDQLRVTWRGGPVARLEPGADIREPQVKLLRNDLLPAGARVRIDRRLTAWSRDLVAATLAPLRPEDAPRGPVRGLLYALERRLGNAPAAEVAEIVGSLRAPERAALARCGVRLGVHHVYSTPMLERPRDRAILWAASRGLPALPPVGEGRAGLLDGPLAGLDDADLAALGRARIGDHWFRLDAYETLAARFRAGARAGGLRAPEELVELVGDDAAPVVLRAAGFTPVDGAWIWDRRGGRGGERRRAGRR